MLTDKKIPHKLKKAEEFYNRERFAKVADVAAEYAETREHFRAEPGRAAKLKWKPAKPGMKWGGEWITAWFRGDVTLPKECNGKKVLVRAGAGCGEAMLIVDGEHKGAFDTNRSVVMIAAKGKAGRKYHLALEAYSGHYIPGCSPDDFPAKPGPKPRNFGGVEIVVEREDVTAFVIDLRVLRQLANALDENSLRRNKIIRGLADVFAVINQLPFEEPEESWRPKLAEARKIMRPLLQLKNGPTTPQFGLIGHSHMDTAWLWPLAETWRKCARTYGTALNLMEQYPEYTFIQAAPLHAEMMRTEYPGIYEKMKKKVAEGKWEPNGAMWVEPDCNVPSGESFVRQLLVGQATTRREYGYTADTLWLPDVFGYSAALPQILQGCNVEFFCTTKISWNDTTRFPFDTFVWKGIDGTSVIAHYNAIQCWPDPETLADQWNWVQHKDVQDRRLCAFGHGDGGGGPMAEMLEVARRVKDLEGCPRTGYTTVSKFMQGIRDELHDLPEYAGELYFELHRGTQTSLARIKRGNRKCEFALRDAEFLCTLATLRGRRYPAAKLLDIWKTLLTNQFHDILPGSSIEEVNIQAVEQLDESLAGAESLADDALKAIAGPARTTNMNLLAVNTLSWERTGAILLDAPKGTKPADENVTAQWIKDIEGNAKLAVSGVTVPALGAASVPLAKGSPRRGESPFKLTGNRLRTPHASIRFDKAGRIVSLVDRASGREVVAPGGALNSILVGEEVPLAWDNWDIDSDYRLKMQVEDRLVKREVIADGPLQLRVRSRYEIGRGSGLTQDMVFHAGSPQIDFETVIDWNDKHRLLKAGFDVNVVTDTARHEIQYGHVHRPTHQNRPYDQARFEVCAHKWTDLSEEGFGVAILNDCKYGVSAVGNRLGLSLIKSGTHPDWRGDAGRHLVTYSLLPHACAFSVESVVRPAYELNVPVVTRLAGPRAKGFGGLLAVDAPSVIVESVKWAEKGNAFVVRLYEAGRTGTTARVKFNAGVKSVSETNMLEEKPARLNLKNDAIVLSMHPFEIKTLVCRV